MRNEKHMLDDSELDLLIGAKNKKRIKVFGRLTKKAFSPITKVLDGIDADYSDRPQSRKALIALFKLKVPVCVLLIIAVVLSGGYFFWNSENTASTQMSLNYEEGAYGLNPNSTRFYVYDIESPEVVEKMLTYCGIDPESVDINDVINSISVRPVNAKTFSEEELFITTTYKISMRKPAAIKGVDVQTLLNFLCKAYKDNFYDNYTENRSILEFDVEDFNDQEYMVIADLFDLKAQQIEKYLNTRSKQSKSFTEEASDETFKSLVQKVDDIKTYDVAKYRSFVKEAGCSHDRARYIRSLEYVNRINRIDYSKDMAAYTVNNQGIKMYNEAMANVVMIPSVDQERSTYYMSRTKTGMDYMAKQADDYLISAQAIAKDIKHNEKIITKMKNGKNESADIEKANRMIKDINKKFAELSKQVESVDKAYVKHKTKDYLTFKASNASFMQKFQLTKVFVIAAALLVFIYASILIRYAYMNRGGRKQ
ncbi:MAG: hypothetical protein IJR60_06575 [Eubacterium sp.]|nr:hypothetical protein [Eubacterium sp.]